ncbi:MAG: FecR family protein [Bacteroidales bacterium]|jgi:ferric-dicitrate binding protein FerR (iron transport regulator)|nr:FecR family protein [Bacteroidales bacterium]
MKELFYKYFSGKTTKEEERRVMDYAESSSTARGEFLGERKLWDACTLHGDLCTKPKTTGKRQPAYIQLLKIAAFFTLAISTGWSAWYLGQTGDGPMQTVRVRPGSGAELTLADGSKVWLNANTEFSYPLSFGKKQRMVTLSGEGYFEVNPGKKPFIVRTGKYDVEALGTTFDIDAYPDNDEITTSLVEGLVKIRTPNHAVEDVILKPDEYLSMGNDTFQKGAFTDHSHFLWRNGILYFDDVSFPDMIKMLGKHYHLKIAIQTPAAMNYRCTGKFRQAEGIDHILRVLQKDVDFKYERLEDNQTIIIK